MKLIMLFPLVLLSGCFGNIKVSEAERNTLLCATGYLLKYKQVSSTEVLEVQCIGTVQQSSESGQE